MKQKRLTAQNIFFLVGFAAVVIMVFAIGLDEIVTNVVKTGWWFLAIIGMWLPIYLINTWALSPSSAMEIRRTNGCLFFTC